MIFGYDEVDVYVRHGADITLAHAIAGVFRLISYAPRYKKLEDGVKYARTASDFESLSLDFLLAEQTEDARKYMQEALAKEQLAEPKKQLLISRRLHYQLLISRRLHSRIATEVYSAPGLVRIILDNFDKIPEILRASFEEIDVLRERHGFAPIRDYTIQLD